MGVDKGYQGFFITPEGKLVDMHVHQLEKEHAHMYRALQLILGFINDTPWHEVHDQDVQSWIEAAKELEAET